MGLFHWIAIGEAGLALSFVMIYASGFAGGGIAARCSPRNHVGDSGGQRALHDLCDATLSRKASRAGKHRRLRRDDRDWRNRRCDLQTEIEHLTAARQFNIRR